MSLYVNNTGKIFGASVLVDLLFNGGRGTAQLGNTLLVGAIGAAALSWLTNDSVLLAVLHGLLGWYYLAWRLAALFLA